MIKNQTGQGLTEYLILVMLISIVSITAVKGLGKVLKNKIEMTEKKISGDVSYYD